MGLPLNRALRDENGEMYDAIAGDFLVVGLGEEDFASLTPELAQKIPEKKCISDTKCNKLSGNCNFR